MNIGDKYGKVEIREKTFRKKGTYYVYVGVCSCGNVLDVTSEIKRVKQPCPKCRVLGKDITGFKNGKLEAMSRSTEKTTNGDYLWIFKCDCGGEVRTSIGRFMSGHTQSCGCLMGESGKLRSNYHGMSQSKEYKSWCKMKERCLSPSCEDYPNYGGVGISVHPPWVSDFRQFLSDMGPMPAKNGPYTLDRIDNSEGYSPENCRWATSSQQARNNYGLPKNNTTGVKGVRWDEKTPGNLYAVAEWTDLNGKKRQKSFSVKKFGKQKAFQLAKEQRGKMINLLNERGAGYSNDHTLNEKVRPLLTKDFELSD